MGAKAETVRPSANPRDRRAVKSSEALRSALLRLVGHRPLEQITIREIAAEAGVHYATFFRHHPTKEALLDLVAADEIDRLVELSLPMLDNASGEAAFGALADYVEDNRTVWTALLTGGAAGAMREALLGISRGLAVERWSDDAWMPDDLAVTCSVSLIFETLAWWLARPVGEIDADRIATILHRLVTSVAVRPDLGAGAGSARARRPDVHERRR